MEAIKQIVRTPANHEIRISLPSNVAVDEPVEVIVIFRKKKSDFQQKISLLQTAIHDTQFLNDLQHVAQDFAPVDSEGWET